MKMTLELCSYSLVGALVIGGAIASSQGYVLAQTPCLPGHVCVRPTWTPRPHRPEPPARIIDLPAIEKLRRPDPQTVQTLEQPDPNSREHLQGRPHK